MGSKRFVLAVPAAILCVVVSAAGALASGSAPPTPAQGLADLNAWRAADGLPAVVDTVPALDDACHLHDEYERTNGLITHYEDPNAPGYTAAGADAGLNSILAESDLLPEAAWGMAPYHRAAALQPRLRHIGFDSLDSSTPFGTCMYVKGSQAIDDSATTSTLRLYPWPADGMTDVPTKFFAIESPDPHVDAGVSPSTTLGYLLTVGVNGPWTDSTEPRSHVTSASLVDGAGHHVAVAASDDTSTYGSGYLAGGFGIFPLEQLAASTTYTAHATGTVSAEGTSYPFELTWHFKTAATSNGGGSGGGKKSHYHAGERCTKKHAKAYRAAGFRCVHGRLQRIGGGSGGGGNPSLFKGKTSQGSAISFELSSDKQSISDLSFGPLKETCAGGGGVTGTPPTFTAALPIQSDGSISVAVTQGAPFVFHFTGHMLGSPATGWSSASGNLTFSTQHNGATCSSGTVTWTVKPG